MTLFMRLHGSACYLLLCGLAFLTSCFQASSPELEHYYVASFVYSEDFLGDSLGTIQHAYASVQDNVKGYAPPNLLITVNTNPLHFTSDELYSTNLIPHRSDDTIAWEMEGIEKIQLPSVSARTKLPKLDVKLIYPTDTSFIPRGGPITIRWVGGSLDTVHIQIFDEAGNHSYETVVWNTDSISLSSEENLMWLLPGRATVRLWKIAYERITLPHMSLAVSASSSTYAHFNIR